MLVNLIDVYIVMILMDEEFVDVVVIVCKVNKKKDGYCC